MHLHPYIVALVGLYSLDSAPFEVANRVCERLHLWMVPVVGLPPEAPSLSGGLTGLYGQKFLPCMVALVALSAQASPIFTPNCLIC